MHVYDRTAPFFPRPLFNLLEMQSNYKEMIFNCFTLDVLSANGVVCNQSEDVDLRNLERTPPADAVAMRFQFFLHPGRFQLHKHSVAWPFTQLIVCHTGKSSPFWQLLAKSDNLQLLRVQQRSQHLCLACRVLILTVVRPTRFRTNCFKDNTRSAILNTFTRIFPRKKSSVSTRYATLPVHTPSKWYTSVKLSEILASCSPFYIHFVESRGFTWTGYGQRTKPLLTGYAK